MAAASQWQSEATDPLRGLVEKIVHSWTSFLHLMSTPAGDAEETPAFDEQALIRSCLGGDHESYEQLVRRYQQQVANLLWRFTRNPTEHEDLVHIVFVEAYISLSKFRGEGAFGAWLSTIATRVGYAFWKQQAKARRRNEVPLESAEEPITAGAGSQADEEFELLERALERLSVRDRLVITLLHLEEHSIAEVAELTGWSQSMVKVQAHRARGRLKKLLETHDDK